LGKIRFYGHGALYFLWSVKGGIEIEKRCKPYTALVATTAGEPARQMGRGPERAYFPYSGEAAGF
jgi:hypothetical protein